VLRLYDPTGTVPDAFYLTYDGLGYFAKGVIGGDTGTSSNRLKNSSFESAQGISSTNAGNIDYWARVTGDSLSTITQDATDFMHGGSSLKIVWTTAGTRGIEASPWVGGLANSTWPATSTWMFSFYCKQTSATTGVPAVSFSGSGITATLIPPPTAAVQNAWQRWVFKIVTTSQVTSSIRITFAHANGTAYIDGAQLERGEVTTAYGPMPEEVPPVFLASADNLQSSNFTSTAGWQIKGDGTATFNSVTVRGRIDAPGYSTNLIQLGKDVGPVAGHMGLSLSQSDFNNIFLQRASDGLVFFRVNAGGAGGAMTFEPSGINNGTLTVTGTITANTLNATSGGTIGNFTISGSSLSGGTITSGSLTSSTVTGGTIRTAASGRRAELSSGFFQGVAFYSGDGNEANHGGVETFVSGGNRLVLTGYCPAWSLYSPPSFFMESGPGATQGASFYISGANYVGLSGLAQFTWLSPWNEWKVFSLPDIGGAILQRAAASSQIGPAPSTARLKKNIRALPESGHANPVWNMKARRFHWDEEKTGNGKHLNTIHTNGTAGLIAEELSEIAADCVYPDEEGLPHAINIFALFGYMVDGMQHMKEEIEILKAELKKRK
jgi:hypothetical protein